MAIHLNRCLSIRAVVLLLVGLSWPAAAHNGAVAIAVPVEGIKIDGDLSDWPEGMRRYPLTLQANPFPLPPPKDSEDFQGDFRVGYSVQENALYIAVEVQDESVVEEEEGTLMAGQDGCRIWIDVNGAPSD